MLMITNKDGLRKLYPNSNATKYG